MQRTLNLTQPRKLAIVRDLLAQRRYVLPRNRKLRPSIVEANRVYHLDRMARIRAGEPVSPLITRGPK